MLGRLSFGSGKGGWRRSAMVLFMVVALMLTALLQAGWADKAKNSSNKKEPHQAARKLLEKAKQLQSKNDFPKAELVLREAVKVDPKWAEVYISQANCYEAMRNYPNAAKSWRKVVEMVPNSLAYKRNLARAESNAFEWSHAEAAWLSIANVDPNDLESRTQLAAICLKDGRLPEAGRYIDEAIELNADDARACVLKAQLDIKRKHYAEAEQEITSVMNRLPGDHPLIEDCVSAMKEIEKGKRNWMLSVLTLVGVPLIIAIIGLMTYRYMRKFNRPVEPVLELESATEDSVCRFLLTFALQKFDLPRGFCWTVSLDGRHLELQVSELIGETSGVAQVSINRKAMNDWLDAHGRAPFLYEVELENENFQKAFSFLIKELSSIRISLGVPVVWKGEILALLLLGRSRTENLEAMRRRFNEKATLVQEVSEKAAIALERLRQRNIKVIDTKTGLWNRDYFEDSLNNIFRGCITANIPMSVFMMRMDQAPALLESVDDDTEADLLYNMAQLIYKAVSGEMNVTICHLDAGVFALIAPGRDGNEAEALAKLLKGVFDRTHLAGPDVRTTGCVAYAVAPEDADEPQALRALLSRAYRDAIYLDGNRIKRAEKIEDKPEDVEEAPQEELIIRRTRRQNDGDSASKVLLPFGKARITSNADLGEALESTNANTRSVPILPGRVVNLGAVAQVKSNATPAATATPPAATAAPSAPKHLESQKSSQSGAEESHESTEKSGAEALVIKRRLRTDEAPASESKAAPATDPADTDYKLELTFDEDGIEEDTQFCSQSVFEDLVDYEFSESEGPCALVYLHLNNLIDIRATGRSAYMQLRRDLAALINVFLREDQDIPGLVGEDDFAIFMTDADIAKASSLADRINLTARNLDSGGFFIVPSLGVVVRNLESKETASEFIARASKLADKPGISQE